MKTLTTDVAVIGAGTAGLTAYRAAIQAGKQALLIEGGPYGTTCARVGCMPSKLLIAAADAVHGAQHTGPFGVHVDGVIRIDGQAVMRRIQQERDWFVGFVLASVAKIPDENKLRGYARFIAPGVLMIDEHTEVHAKSVVIATGSSASIPAMFQDLDDRLVINDAVFDWNDLPKRIAVFGPGVIGLEIGQALARLGVIVRVFGMSGSLAGITDPEVRQAAKNIFQQEFYLDPDARVLETKRVGNEVAIRYVALDQTERTEIFDYALVATGRRPNLDSLGLEHAGIVIKKNTVPDFNRQTMQVGDTSVFIAGDVNADHPFLHEAVDEGKIAGKNAAHYPELATFERRASLAIVFSDPQIALVGDPLSKLKCGSFVTGKVDFSDQGRARVMLKNKGVLHVYVQYKTRLFLGAEMIGPRAEHIGHLLAWALQQGLSVDQMLEMPFYHPVIEEGLRSALHDAQSKLDQA